MDDCLCARCARIQETCCQVCEIYVSPGDARRIASHVGRRDFFEDRPPIDARYADQDDDPLWRDQVFRPDGSRRVLKRASSGDCGFLGSAGCVLPLEVRPIVCRLYPFEYDATGLKDELSEGCPMHLIRPDMSLLGELGMNPDDGRRWHAMLYDEITLESAFRADHSMIFGEPEPATADSARS